MGKKTYRVTGEQTVAEHAPGKEFSHDFDDEQEALLIQSGAIKPVTKASGKTEEKED